MTTLLIEAILLNDLDAIQYLIQRGDDINEYPKTNKYPALFIAVQYGYIHIIRLLLENGADINLRFDKKTVFNDIFLYGDNEYCINTIELLLQYKADINSQDCDGDILLFEAVYQNRVDVVKYLLDHGANINHTNNFNQTVLFIPNMSIEMCLLLIHYKIDCNHQNSNGDTALHVMVYDFRPYLQLVTLLVQYTNINIKSNLGETILDLASDVGCRDVVRLLLEHGAVFTSRNKFSYTIERIYDQHLFNLIEPHLPLPKDITKIITKFI